MSLYDVRYFVTTPPIPGRFPYQDTWKRTEDYALDVLPLEKPAVWEQDGYRAYRVVQPPIPFPFRVDVGTPGAEPYLGGGWDVRTDEQPYNATANWATDRTAELYLPLDAPKDATLRLAIAPLSYPGAPAQKLSITDQRRAGAARSCAGSRLADGRGEAAGGGHAPRPEPRPPGIRPGCQPAHRLPGCGQPGGHRRHGRRQPGQPGGARLLGGVHQRVRPRWSRGEGFDQPPRLQRRRVRSAHRQAAGDAAASTPPPTPTRRTRWPPICRASPAAASSPSPPKGTPPRI